MKPLQTKGLLFLWLGMIKRPGYLKKGDTIGIVATARSVKPEEIEPAVRILESWGLKVVLSDYLYEVSGQFAGEDKVRKAALQHMINNPDIKAIACARGGYGTTRIIDCIDFTPLLHTPKWVIGFSDITVLLYQLYKVGVESIHGIMPGLFHKPEMKESVESLRRALFGHHMEIVTPYQPLNKLGTASGPVVGGNLSIINNIIGTGSDIDTAGKILFIEDLDEYLYHVDRMMVHLKRAGKLQRLKALVVGGMSDMNDNPTPFGKDAYEIIHEHVSSYDYPVCFGMPIGHEAINLAIPFGREATITIGEGGSKLVFRE